MPLTHGSALLVTPGWTRDGGVATHVIASATALAEHGIDVHVLAKEIESPVPRGVTMHRAPHLFNRRLSPAARLGDWKSPCPTIVHLHQFDDPEVLAFIKDSAPVLTSTHGYTACTSGVHYFRPGEECTRPHGPGCVPNLLARGCAHTRDPRTLPAAYRRAGRGVQALRSSDLAISYSSTIDRHLATNGVSRRAIVPLFTTMAPTSAGGHATRRRVVFAGRVVTPKGIGILIRAAREVDAEFVICGDGWQLEAMRRLARRLRIEERVHFKGWLTGEQLARELAEASVLAMPSLWPEPFGLVGIEAHAAGRPVIASSTGGVGDWLTDGVSGVCVRPGDPRALAAALAQLLADPNRQAEMGAAGKANVSARFSKERHVAVLLEAYGRARATWESAREDGSAAAARSGEQLEPSPS